MIRRASAVAIALIVHTTPLFGQTSVPAAELIVKTASADVHKFPTVASPVIATAPGGTVLAIRRNLGSWVEVAWPNTEAGVAFLHVNAGTINARATAAAPNPAQDAVAQIRAVAAAATSATGSESGARATQSAAARQTGLQNQTYVSLPQHRVGMGAMMNASEPKFGFTARTWWKRGLGVQFSASPTQLESVDGQLVTGTQFAPSVLYSLPDAVSTVAWLRPYAGAGPRVYRLNQVNGFGYEGFGGAETTFAAMPQFSLSAELAYRWARPTITDFAPKQIGFSLAGHWYVK
jgi:hypothetical protein